MERENSFWSEEGFLNAITCYGPYSLKEFLPFLNERLGDVDSHIESLKTRDPFLARSRLIVHLEKPIDLEKDEARISFDFQNPECLDFLELSRKNHRFYNSSFNVEIFNRNFKKISVSFPYYNGYKDTLSIKDSDDLSPILSLMLQIMYESMLYASVSDRYKSGFAFIREVNLHITQKHYEFLNPLMKEGFKNAFKWINTHITSDQEAKRKQAYLDFLVRIQFPGNEREHSSLYESRFYL